MIPEIGIAGITPIIHLGWPCNLHKRTFFSGYDFPCSSQQEDEDRGLPLNNSLKDTDPFALLPESVSPNSTLGFFVQHCPRWVTL